jgi:hypothetical protein
MSDSLPLSHRTRLGGSDRTPLLGTGGGQTTTRFPWTVAELWKVPERAGSYAIHGYSPGRDVYEGSSTDLRRSLLDHFRERDLWFVPAFVDVSLRAEAPTRASSRPTLRPATPPSLRSPGAAGWRGSPTRRDGRQVRRSPPPRPGPRPGRPQGLGTSPGPVAQGPVSS